MHFYSLRGDCLAFSGSGGAIAGAWRGTWERVAGQFGERVAVYFERVAVVLDARGG